MWIVVYGELWTECAGLLMQVVWGKCGLVCGAQMLIPALRAYWCRW